MNIAIQPVSVFPGTANQLEIDNSWANTLDAGPRFNYRLQYNPGGGAAPTTLKEDIVYMTPSQWNSWSSGTDDSSYILSCALANLGLTAAS